MKLGDLARLLDADLKGDPELEITGVNSLEEAGPSELTLYLGGAYKRMLGTTRARAMVTGRNAVAAEGFMRLEVDRPRLTFITAIRHFHPERRLRGIDPRAVVSPSAVIGEGVYLGPGAVVGEGSVVGDGTEIHANAVLYENVVVGGDCRIHAGVVLREGTRLGHRVIIHPGAVLGADGFGFEPDGRGVLHKIPQVGIVVVGDDVEIGANTCIDRAAFGETRIGRGTKIDNLCQFGHGDHIGSDCVVSGNAGVAGSVTIGNNVVLGGGAAVKDHVTIGDRVIVAGMSGVTSDVPSGSVVAGFPHTDLRTWRRMVIALKRLAKRGGAAEGGGATP